MAVFALCGGSHASREQDMDNLTPAPAAQTQELLAAYAGLNRNDISAFIKNFDSQVVWSEPSEFPGGGTYHGLAAVMEHFTKSRADWAEGTCEPQRFIAAGDKIIVFAHVHVRLKHESEFREGDIADVYTFREGRIISGRVFADRKEALAWAGVKAEP